MQINYERNPLCVIGQKFNTWQCRAKCTSSLNVLHNWTNLYARRNGKMRKKSKADKNDDYWLAVNVLQSRVLIYFNLTNKCLKTCLFAYIEHFQASRPAKIIVIPIEASYCYAFSCSVKHNWYYLSAIAVNFSHNNHFYN